ncbi:MAG: prepilin-type N-terminal cleavage/methylation domain-containing protein [Oscillospiraceae bacterium]|nr:prepilin-type N-terminal cleavage/methylation domain-containing protein [Oscillospiraceae bacterium]
MKNKKGFTMVELIVVVAIIGVLVSIAIPSYISSQRRAQARAANEQAQGFYFALQQTLTPMLAGDNTANEFAIITGTNTSIKRVTASPQSLTANFPDMKFYIYIEVSNSTITYADLIAAPHLYSPATPSNVYVNAADTAIKAALSGTVSGFNARAYYNASPSSVSQHADNDKLLKIIIDELQTHFKLSSISEGYFYAMFDTELRVDVAYYSQSGSRAITQQGSGAGNRYRFSRDGEINGRVFGAFPNEFSYIGTHSYNSATRVWFDLRGHNGTNFTGPLRL